MKVYGNMDSCQIPTILSRNAFGTVFIRKIRNALEITKNKQTNNNNDKKKHISNSFMKENCQHGSICIEGFRVLVLYHSHTLNGQRLLF